MVGGCEKCGRLDPTLRGARFLYTISLVFMTRRHSVGGVYCKSCRMKAGVKYTLISAVMGWWGFPWGPIYTLQSIGVNVFGGEQDRELNANLLLAVAGELIEQGDKEGAISALDESLRLNNDGDARRVLWSLQGELAGEPSAESAIAGSATTELATTQEVVEDSTRRDRIRNDADARQRSSLTSEVANVPVSEAEVRSAPVVLGVAAGPRFAPGALVRAINANASLYRQAGGAGDLVSVITLETAVVMRAQAGWLEVQVPGAGSGWVAESEVESV